jgi:hypothetical protein
LKGRLLVPPIRAADHQGVAGKLRHPNTQEGGLKIRLDEKKHRTPLFVADLDGIAWKVLRGSRRAAGRAPGKGEIEWICES